MLTPIEIQSKSFKSGIGYDRKDVDAFLREVLAGYEKLYKENVEIKDKFTVLNERLQYYKTIEKTLQKALLLAEQTAEETKQTAMRNAKVIEKEARNKADMIVADAKNELNHVNQMITRLTQQYESYKVQYKQLASSQIDLLKSPTFELTLMNGETFNTSYTNPVDASKLESNVNRNPETEDIFAAKEERAILKEERNRVEQEEKVVKKAPLEKEDLDYLKEHVKEFFQEDIFQEDNTQEELAQGYKEQKDREQLRSSSEYPNQEFKAEEREIRENFNQSSSSNPITNSDMGEFTMVEEATLEGETVKKPIKSGTIESDFDFMDFEVNLD